MLGITMLVQGDKVTPNEIEVHAEAVISRTFALLNFLTEEQVKQRVISIISSISRFNSDITKNAIKTMGMLEE